MTKSAEVDRFLNEILPHARRLIVEIDPERVDVFDAVFLDAAQRAAADLRGEAPEPGEGSDQGLGAKNIAATTVLSLVINIVAAIAVESASTRYPGLWSRITGRETTSINALDFAVGEAKRSALEPGKKQAVISFLTRDPIIRKALQDTYIRVGR